MLSLELKLFYKCEEVFLSKDQGKAPKWIKAQLILCQNNSSVAL